MLLLLANGNCFATVQCQTIGIQNIQPAITPPHDAVPSPLPLDVTPLPPDVNPLPPNIAPLPQDGPRVPPSDFKGKLLLLDAGHGGHDPGAVRLGVREKDIALAMVLDLKKVLEARGAKVVLTRKDDKVDLELAAIARIVDAVHPDVFLSIHVNSAGNDQAMSGVQTYFRESGSRCLAHTMHSVLVCDLPVNDRGVYTSHFYVLNNPSVPSLLLETGYITNRPERRNLMTPSYRHKFCLAIADGLSRYWIKSSGSAGFQPASPRNSR